MIASDATLGGALLLIVMLQMKHAICDGPLQTLRMVQDKSFYGRPQGLLHALVHGIGTAAVLLLAGLPVPLVAGLAAADAALHYHIDFAKENIVKKAKWTTGNGPFWWALTTDQTLHHMTYVMLVWLALKP